MSNRLRGSGASGRVIALLGLASLACVVLVVARVARSHTTHYGFLPGNLVLAWIPLGLAIVAYLISRRRSTLARLMIVPTAFVWLLFFPNAPYIVTDLVHLGDVHDNVPAWYDVMLITWFAWTGLLLGIVSLRVMQGIVARSLGARAGWVMVVAVTALGSVGIYVGRFLRWNSWYAFSAPETLAERTWYRASQLDAPVRLLTFSLLFGLLFLFVYAAVDLLGRSEGPPP